MKTTPYHPYAIREDIGKEGKYTACCFGCARFFHKVKLKRTSKTVDGNSEPIWLCVACVRVAKHNKLLGISQALGVSTDLLDELIQVYSSAKYGSGKRGLEFNLSLEFVLQLYVAQKGRCALSDVPMEYGGRGGKDVLHASLDRISSDGGYVPNNVQWVCWGINAMKGTLDQEMFVELCRLVVAKENGVDTTPVIDAFSQRMAV